MIDKRSYVPLMIAAALALAGCVDGATEPLDAAASETALPGTMAIQTPFAKDGSIAPGAYVCPVVTCVGVEPSDRVWDLSFAGTLVGLNLTLTWEATTPATEELVLGIGHGSADARDYDMVSGPSPLALALDGLNLTGEDEVSVFVWMEQPVPVAGLTTPQDFHVEGALATSS